MRVAIISDIHGNITALEAVLDDLRSRGVEASYCLGDLVGYAPFPNEVIEGIQRDQIPTIMGNYDDGVGFDRDECGCAYRDPEEQRLGDMSLEWTKRAVTPERKAFLRGLQPEIRFEADGKRFRLVHGSPRRMNEYLFEDRPLSSFQRLAATSDCDALIFGHTHKPYTKRVDGVLFLNAGSVGKPKDGDPRACYAVLDTAGDISVEFRRIPYDISKVATAIRQSDLPDKFATDIETGGSSPAAAASAGDKPFRA
jgi:putative phosphoesterase